MTVALRNQNAFGLGLAAARAPRKLADGTATEGKSKTLIDEEFAAWRDAQLIVTTCAFCAWRFEGSVAMARIAAVRHREAEHPEAAVRRPRRSSRIKLKKNLTEAEREQASLDAMEANRIRAEREDADRLAKVERALERERKRATQTVAVEVHRFGLQRSGRGWLWTRDAAILAVREYEDTVGVMPRLADARREPCGTLPSQKSADSLFGGWDRLLAAAALEEAA